MTTIIFDIETIPDISSGKKIFNEENNKNEEEIMQKMINIKPNSKIIPHYLQKIILISLLIVNKNELKIISIGNFEIEEKEIIELFFEYLNKYLPTLVSWNGNNFDIPVINYRSIINEVPNARYWDNGTIYKEYKWNNYQNRYHTKHIDLMEVISVYNSNAYSSLNNLSIVCNLPGKMLMKGEEVYNYYKEKKINEIKMYCEIDIINTYLIYLKYLYVKTIINQKEYKLEIKRLKENILNNSDNQNEVFKKILKIIKI